MKNRTNTMALAAFMIISHAMAQDIPPDQHIIDGALSAFSNLVTYMTTGNSNAIQSMIANTNIQISSTPRTTTKEYGADINLAFATNGFHEVVYSVRLTDGKSARIRTSSTYVRLQVDDGGKWKIAEYLDKPIK